MMLRQLLTLLAVFAGLTAAVEPAQALSAGVETVRLADSASPCQAPAAPMAQRLAQDRRADQRTRPCIRTILQYAAPTVNLQADRARE